MVDLQRRQLSGRADQLLDGLQAADASAERVDWNESGHARLAVAGQPDEVRAAMAARLDSLGDDWSDHIAIL
jgi:alkanesulfonate monooxygenase SsuD/methylene tetrahydromethanopterin reductase-like flavin-dependent oxidoreductase (luciferase family)